jgi:alpha-tubulin suppressor-like RCC1 family protein
LGLKKNGKVISWGAGESEGHPELTEVPADLTNVVAIAAGSGYSLALTKDGIIRCWGVRDSPSGLSNIVAIAAGEEHYSPCFALDKDGIVYEWGPSRIIPPHVVASNAVAIAAGTGHGLALRSDGTVFGWGSNGSGAATGNPTTLSPYSSAGTVTVSGKVLTQVVAIAAGNGFSLALKKDGTLVAWGRRNNGLHPITVPEGLKDVIAISAGDEFCLAVTSNTNNLAMPR